MRRRILRDCLRIAREKCNPESHPEYNCYIHYSFVIQNNKIVEYGFNRQGKPPAGFGYNPEFGKIHSETDAFRKAKGILDFNKPFDIVNIRLNKRGALRLSAPCSCCSLFLNVVGCRNIFFSTNDGFAKVV